MQYDDDSTDPMQLGVSAVSPASALVDRLLSADIEGLEYLIELALDQGQSWSRANDRIWRDLDAEIWALTDNPWVVLQTVSHEVLEQRLSEATFRGHVQHLIDTRRQAAETRGWFRKNHPAAPLRCVAYFSMEFMLSEALPIYSGGLGNVAGDQLKAASDLGVPVVGIGLLYQQGYFRQLIDAQGEQQAAYPYNDPGQLPIVPLRRDDGEWLRVEITLPDYSVWLRAWQVQVGRLHLYLLDSNDAANYPAHRGITSELYGGDAELRLKQEMVLGIGGWRLLEALGVEPEVCHLNEGHAALAVLERARSVISKLGCAFDEALMITRVGNLFTTHTAVAAGFDRFPPALVERYLGDYAQDRLGLNRTELLALGRRDDEDPTEPFNMAYLACRGSGAVNGVSHLHATVSREIFMPLFPRWPQAEVPIHCVTNGVHMPSWQSVHADTLWQGACGKDRWLESTQDMAERMQAVSDADLWQMRTAASRELVIYARGRLARLLAAGGAGTQAVANARHMFQPDILTIGFARRFASYKRPNLLLHDRERLLRLFKNAERPIQLIIAGKAHPADTEGRALIRSWIQFIRQPEVRPHVMFLADYDMRLTEQLVRGVDVWLNTPRRPWEACGTSGMKVLVNGGLNLSELDGWWAQAYTPEVGWALGDGYTHEDEAVTDAADARALYALLEDQVIPEFYERGEDGIPHAWTERMRQSMARLTPQFSTNRTVREYTERFYLPAAAAYRRRRDKDGALGRAIAVSQREREAWRSIRFDSVNVQSGSDRHFFEVQIYLGNVSADSIQVQLYADGRPGSSPVIQPMTPASARVTAADAGVYRGDVPATRPAADYTPRIIPSAETLSVPLEDPRIHWQR